MTVKELLDGYYGFIYSDEGIWEGAVDNEGTQTVSAEYSDELLGTARIQFSLTDEGLFKVTSLDDPLEETDEDEALLAVLNKIYVTSFMLEHQDEDTTETEEALLERLSAVDAAAVRYGAPTDYSGNRGQLCQAFGDTTANMSAEELLGLYGVIGDSEECANSAIDGAGYTGIWVSEGTAAWESGVTLDLEITERGDGTWDVYISVAKVSDPPAMRQASFEKSFTMDGGAYIQVPFEDDGWGNSGVLELELLDGRIGIESRIQEYSDYSMWELEIPYMQLYMYDAPIGVEEPTGLTYNPYGLYQSDSGLSMEFFITTGEDGGFILNAGAGMFTAMADEVSQDMTQYFFYDGQGGVLVMTLLEPGEMWIECVSGSFKGVAKADLDGEYYLTDRSVGLRITVQTPQWLHKNVSSRDCSVLGRRHFIDCTHQLKRAWRKASHSSGC